MTSSREDMHPVVLVLHTPLEVNEVAQAIGARFAESKRYLDSAQRQVDDKDPDPSCCDRCRAAHVRNSERIVEAAILQQRHDADQAISRRLIATEADFVDSEPKPDSQALMDLAVAAVNLIEAQRYNGEHPESADGSMSLDAAWDDFDRLVRTYADNQEQ